VLISSPLIRSGHWINWPSCMCTKWSGCMVCLLHSIRQRPKIHISLLVVLTGSVGDPVEDEFNIPSTDRWAVGAYNPVFGRSFEGVCAISYGELE